jgi:hypothetical protein
VCILGICAPTLNGSAAYLIVDAALDSISTYCDQLTIVYGSVTTYSNNQAYGSVSSATCDFGYIQSGGSTSRTCDFSSMSKGTWNGTDLVCSAIPNYCPVLNNPLNGEVTVSSYSIGSNATWNCTSGFFPSQNVSTCMAFNATNGQWNTLATCSDTPTPTPVPTPIPTPSPTPIPTPVPTPVPTSVPTPIPTPIPTPTSTERTSTDTLDTTTLVTMIRTSNDENSNIGPIIGGSIGAILFVIIVLVLVFFIQRRFRQRRSTNDGIELPNNPIDRNNTHDDEVVQPLSQTTKYTSNTNNVSKSSATYVNLPKSPTSDGNYVNLPKSPTNDDKYANIPKSRTNDDKYANLPKSITNDDKYVNLPKQDPKHTNLANSTGIYANIPKSRTHDDNYANLPK